KLARLFVFALLCGLLASCGVYPHRVYSVPEIRGTFAENGVPIVDAVVLIAQKRDDPCKEASPHGTTNARGEFLITEKTETKFFWFLNRPDTIGKLTALCFQVPGEPIVFGGQVSHMEAESVVLD